MFQLGAFGLGPRTHTQHRSAVRGKQGGLTVRGRESAVLLAGRTCGIAPFTQLKAAGAGGDTRDTQVANFKKMSSGCHLTRRATHWHCVRTGLSNPTSWKKKKKTSQRKNSLGSNFCVVVFSGRMGCCDKTKKVRQLRKSIIIKQKLP